MRIRVLNAGKKLPKVPQGMVEVAVNEEYGFRSYRFLFFGSKSELIAWWQRQETSGMFSFSRGNKVFAIAKSEIPRYWRRDHKESLVFIRRSKQIGFLEYVPCCLEHKWLKVVKRCQLLIHIHEADDTYLHDLSTNEYFFHAGYMTQEEIEKRDAAMAEVVKRIDQGLDC